MFSTYMNYEHSILKDSENEKTVEWEGDILSLFNVVTKAKVFSNFLIYDNPELIDKYSKSSLTLVIVCGIRHR